MIPRFGRCLSGISCFLLHGFGSFRVAMQEKSVLRLDENSGSRVEG